MNWLFLTLFCVLVQGFYSMNEMAALSINRARLDYYASQGMRRARWLQFLLQKPSRLFGTIMLGVNIALQIGSQSSREFYRAMNLNPDIAPLTQVFLVVIFAELSPLFAARRYAEKVALIGIPFVYATYRLFAPFIFLISQLTRFIHRLIKQKDEHFDIFLSRDELQKVLEEFEEDEFNLIISNLFSLGNKTAKQVMIPLYKVKMLEAKSSLQQLRYTLQKSEHSFIPLYHKTRLQIVGMAFPIDYLLFDESKTIREKARQPWFITSTTKLTTILEQFRRNNQRVAIVLGENGKAQGVLTLDDILEEIFPERSLPKQEMLRIERTFPGETKVSEFNLEYGTSLEAEEGESLAQLVVKALGHPPEQGDLVTVGSFEFYVEEASLIGIKQVTVRSS